MGFWRNAGYVWASLMIIGGLILFPFGLISIGLAIFLIVFLKNNAKNEKIEKHLSKIAGVSITEQERIQFREWQEKKSRQELE